MNDKFTLVRKSRSYAQKTKWPKVHTSEATYAKLTEWAEETGLPLSVLVGKAVDFADAHCVFVEE